MGERNMETGIATAIGLDVIFLKNGFGITSVTHTGIIRGAQTHMRDAPAIHTEHRHPGTCGSGRCMI
jgi:hypothetical protein